MVDALNILGIYVTSLIGAGDQSGREEVEFVTEFRYVPEGWLGVVALLVLTAVVWAVVWMYRNEGRIGASSRVRWIAAGLRCVVLIMLAAILLEPVSVRLLRRWIDSYTVVLVDHSASMDLTDSYRDDDAKERARKVLAVDTLDPTKRTEIVSAVLGGDERRFVRNLAERNRVKIYSFSDEPHLRAMLRNAREQAAADPDGLGESNGTSLTASLDDESVDSASWGSATGSATNIERALRRSVSSVGNAPIAGVVVLSDGGFNQGASAEDTGAYAKERGFPIHVVGIGDPSSPTNVRVAELSAPPNAFLTDPFSVTARLVAVGMDGRSIRVLLRESKAGGANSQNEGRIVDSRDVQVGAGGRIAPIAFERSVSNIGRHAYTLEVPVLDGESVTDDNSKRIVVNVLDSRLRVLLVAGGPSWEYRYVSRLLERDRTFDVSCWLQSADQNAVRDGNTIIDHLPFLAEELFEYDVVILMDVEKDELDEPWCQKIDTLVTEHGGGLLVTAARVFTPEFMRDRTLEPLLDLLPVVLDPEADLVLNRVGHYQVSAAPIEIPTTAYGHPILKLADDPASTRLAWLGVGVVYWHYPVLREKPLATVLMRHGDPRMQNAAGGHVLAATQYVGAGRTAFLGFDATWRWRRTGVESFNRFWVQLVRYLAEGRVLGGAKRGSVLTEADQYSLGDSVTVTARLFDRQFKPLSAEQVVARYACEGSTTEFRLAPQTDRPGWLEGRFVPDRTGTFQILVKSAGAVGDEPLEISRDVTVSRPNIEILRPQMDRAELMTLAEQSDGGQYFEVDKAQELPKLIPDLHEEILTRSRPTTLWDNWVVMGLLFSLLTFEWGLRKWNRLL